MVAPLPSANPLNALPPHLAQNPRDDARWAAEATRLYQSKRYPEAVECFRMALRLKPDHGPYFADLGIALRADQRLGESEAMLREAIRRMPSNPLPVFTLANLFTSQRRWPEAEQAYLGLIKVNPEFFAAIENLGSLLIETNRPADAETLVRAYLARKPNDASALSMLAITLDRLNRLDEALDVTINALTIAPPKLLDMRLASYMSLVGRTGRLDLRKDVMLRIRAALDATLPGDDPRHWHETDRNALRRFTFLFPYYGMPDRDLLKVHRALGLSIASNFKPLIPPPQPKPGRMRVGYLSYNFGNHPIGHLLSPFFEAHGHQDHELYFYSLHQSMQDASGYGPRLKACADHYRDCRGMSDMDLARIIRDDDLHILIDLDGYLHGGRPEVLATRPARVQIHWLQSLSGCPAPYFDYTIVDRVIVPDDEREHGNGPLIRLADAFQCGERFELLAAPPSRSELGLPENAFVFCAFGNWLKIDETVFECWMRILNAVENSVLWLTEGPSQGMVSAIQNMAKAHGVDPARLIMAKRTDAKEPHINRHRVADLFLDTFTFSAATTATDALSAGLPVLTKRGNTAQGRLAESLVRATGPTALIVDTVEDYIATAIRLAHDRTELAHHHKELADALRTAHLFDAPRMVAQFEQIYREVWCRYATGERPTHFDVVM